MNLRKVLIFVGEGYELIAANLSGNTLIPRTANEWPRYSISLAPTVIFSGFNLIPALFSRWGTVRKCAKCYYTE